MPEFYMIFCQKNTLFPIFWVQFPALKPRVSGVDPNTKYVIKVNIVLRCNHAKYTVYAPPYVTLQH